MADISTPLWLQAGTYAADDDRALLRAICSGAGIVGAGHLLVAQHGTPNMSVDVAIGRAFVQRTSATDFYLAENDSIVNPTIAASDPTNPRRDLIVVRIYDSAYSGALDKATVEVVTGTPAASPVDPTAPSNSYTLARVAVAAAATSITNANITDLRAVYTRARSSAVPTPILFTTSGTLTAAQVAGAIALRVRVAGSGGGSGGVATTGAGASALSGGGGEGQYAESILDINSITFPVTVTIGAAGTAGAAGNNAGGNASACSFGTYVIGGGGSGGGGSASSAGTGICGLAGAGGTGGTGQILLAGAPGAFGWVVTGLMAVGAQGGGSHLATPTNPGAASVGNTGVAGTLYGGGAAGARLPQSSTQLAGAVGALGIVIVEPIYG